MTPEELQAENERLREALATCCHHSLLAIRRAAFSPTIGVRYTEAIRADIASECARLEQFVGSVLDTPEPVTPQTGIVGADMDRDDGDTVGHD